MCKVAQWHAGMAQPPSRQTKSQGSGGTMSGQSLPTANKIAHKLTEPEKRRKKKHKKPAAAQMEQKNFCLFAFSDMKW